MYNETSGDPSNTARVYCNLMVIMMITESDICETRNQCDIKVGFVNCACLLVTYCWHNCGDRAGQGGVEPQPSRPLATGASTLEA